MPKIYRYRNTSGQAQAIIGVSEVAAGAIIESREPINNQNLELVDTEEADEVEPADAPAEQRKPSKK